MGKFPRMVAIFGSTLLSLNIANSNVPNHDNPTTFLGPTVKLGLTSPLTDATAFSVAGEAGIKNFRVGGTLGLEITDAERIKVSGEYLWQDITYPFFSGNVDRWVSQFAIGGAYEYLVRDIRFKPEFDIAGYYAYAPSQSLSTVTGTYVNKAGVSQYFVDNRRIAGSNAFGIAPGIAIQPWRGGKVGAALNWDDVNYRTKFINNADAKGLGGTFYFNQSLSNHVVLSGIAAVRKPFNNYGGSLALNQIPFHGVWTVGVNGEYTTGKNNLPNTYNVGVSFDYFFDEPSVATFTQNDYKYMDFKGETSMQAPVDDDSSANHFLAWTAQPAVYMPQVLAIPDEKVTTTPICNAPLVTGSLPNLEAVSGTPQNVNAAAAFSDKLPLSFSYNVTPAPAPTTISLNSSSGLMTIMPLSSLTTRILTVTITATNSCGSSSSTSFTDTVPGSV